jgi:hypothetical protein
LLAQGQKEISHAVAAVSELRTAPSHSFPKSSREGVCGSSANTHTPHTPNHSLSPRTQAVRARKQRRERRLAYQRGEPDEVDLHAKVKAVKPRVPAAVMIPMAPESSSGRQVEATAGPGPGTYEPKMVGKKQPQCKVGGGGYY